MHTTCECHAVPVLAFRVRSKVPNVCVEVPVTRTGDGWCSADPDHDNALACIRLTPVAQSAPQLSAQLPLTAPAAHPLHRVRQALIPALACGRRGGAAALAQGGVVKGGMPQAAPLFLPLCSHPCIRLRLPRPGCCPLPPPALACTPAAPFHSLSHAAVAACACTCLQAGRHILEPCVCIYHLPESLPRKGRPRHGAACCSRHGSPPGGAFARVCARTLFSGQQGC